MQKYLKIIRALFLKERTIHFN